MPSLPSPRATLAGCVWLPRIVAKVRAQASGVLPAEYGVRLGAPDGVDGQFLGFFGLTREQILQAGVRPDDAVANWFLGCPGVTAERIAAWNRTAVSLGREGFPMAERLPVALATKYAHLQGRGIQTVFEMLEADEGLLP